MQHRNVRALLIHTLARPTIKALTLTQPWATLVASGAKEYETRSWQRGYRGPVAIHAARGDPSEAHWLCEQDPFRQALHHALHTDGTLPGSVLAAALPVGKVIAIALLDALHPTERLRTSLSEQKRAFGNYHDGRFAWHFAVVYRLIVTGVCTFSVVLAIGSLWLFMWTRGIPRRALRKTAREGGVSEAYLRAVITNNADVCAGRISRQEWERRAMKIAYQFSQDSGIRAHLREQEGLCE